jgi:MOSC domain-containing protein YiiM
MTIATRHLTADELEAGLDEITRAPKDGVLEMIVRRPSVGEREMLQEGQLDPAEGLVGDNWKHRGTGTPNAAVQLTVMNARVAELVSQDRSRWQLAGDQLYVDMDLSDDNLPAGTQLLIGTAVIEVSAIPHTGCAKFVGRFGADAMKFVNAPEHKSLHMRGINTRVVRPGVIRVGDTVTKLPAGAPGSVGG